MSKNVLQSRTKKISAIIMCASILLFSTSCEPSDVRPTNNYQIDLVSSPEGDIPISMPVEVVVGIKNIKNKLQNLFFDFSSNNLSIIQGGASVAPGQKVPVNLEGSSLVKFTATGLKAGTHTITVRAESGGAASSCVVSLTMSDKVYRVEILNTPVLRIGEQQTINVKVTDMQDPQHMLYTTPGYKIGIRSLDDRPTMIWDGAELLWDSFTGAAIEKTRPIQWANNETIVMYQSFYIGQQRIEFTVTDPKGYSSRSVHTLNVDSSRVVLTAARVPLNVVSVTEAYEPNYKVDYLGHPHNKLSCKWERLDVNDPYNSAPALLLEGVKNPPAGQWLDYARVQEVGVSAYPAAPNMGGSKQGFRMHVKDLYGWDTTFTYRFDVTSSEFSLSLEPTGTYVQNTLCSAVMVLSNYPKGSDMTYKYRVEHDFGENNSAGPVSFWTLDPYRDEWTTIDLSGADGTPLRRHIDFGFSTFNGLNNGAFVLIMVDKFGTEHRARFCREFALNNFNTSTFDTQHNLVVGGSGDKSTATIRMNYILGQEGAQSFGRTTISIYEADPAATVTIDGKIVSYNSERACFEEVIDKKNPVITYTPHKAGFVELNIENTLWTGGSTRTKVKINAVDDYGTFAATTDQSAYLIPYIDPRVTQDITLTLASGKEPAGVYDWDDVSQIGTSIKMSHLVGDRGTLYAVDVANGKEVLVQSSDTPLKYAVGKTIQLRYYPAAINGGSLERLKLTITRKDGQTTEATCTAEAEDEGFTVVIALGESVYDRTKVGEVMIGGGIIKVTSRSKYYQGGYQLKSYDNKPRLTDTGEAILENLPPTKGGLGIKHTSTVEGWACIYSAVVADENGHEVSSTRQGAPYLILP